jgi:16S rRNA (cytidine1402-2'-O)-methyltransferase
MSLVFVPTPLGNLRDITLRALDVLRDADLIVAEDTRVTRRLLSAHGISGKAVTSYREQNAALVTPHILARAQAAVVAVVSDAGMPGVCDPGRELLVAARAAGIAVEVLPGPVAYVTAAVLSGFDLNGLTFAGFVPRAAGARTKAFLDALARSGPTAWYESPRRIAGTLEALESLAPAAHVFVARELTKVFEQQAAGNPAEVGRALEQPVRGELVLVLAPLESRAAPKSASSLDAAIDDLLEQGASVAAAAKTLVQRGFGERGALYARVSERRSQSAAGLRNRGN